MANQVMELRLLALALWNAHGNVGVALKLPEETARLLIQAGYSNLDQILTSTRRDLRRSFHLKPDHHLRLVEEALACFELNLEPSPSELTDVRNAMIIPAELSVNL